MKAAVLGPVLSTGILVLQMGDGVGPRREAPAGRVLLGLWTVAPHSQTNLSTPSTQDTVGKNLQIVSYVLRTLNWFHWKLNAQRCAHLQLDR